MSVLRAPFPWFGGKSKVADLVWPAFGNIKNYVEPFFGSGAVLLARPWSSTRTETINDIDGMIANFWRAVAANPDAVAECCDWPVNENDLHARHVWLLAQKSDLVDRLNGDPHWFDATVAGYWCWGVCTWIGGGFCSGKGPWYSIDGKLVKRKGGDNQGIYRNRPHLGDRGVKVNISDDVYAWFVALSDRLRKVRVCCGDWSRVCGSAPTTHVGLTGIFLDPPYSDADRRVDTYASDSLTVELDVRQWCIKNGNNKLLRIVLCGYERENDELAEMGWRVLAWKASGGHGGGKNKRGDINRYRERIWFSPHCKNLEEVVRGY